MTKQANERWKHTPGTWSYKSAQKGFGDERLDTGIFAEIEGANRIIVECFGRVGQSLYLDSEANARHIVRCVNGHEGLVEALRDLMKSCQNWAPTIDCSRARAALRQAEEEL